MSRFVVAASALGLAVALAGTAHAQSNQFTGFHVGLNAGGGVGNTNTAQSFYTVPGGVFTPDAPLSPGVGRFGTSGFIGGGQFGFDTSIGSLIVGAEGDFAGSTVSGKQTSSGIDANLASFNQTQKLDLNWLATLRARFGYELFPGWMPYVTGGLAFADMKGTSTTTGGGVSYSSSSETIRTGGVVGLGLDYAVMPNFTIGAQYLYTSFDAFGTNSIQTPGGLFSKSTTFTPDLNVFRLTFNYHFGAPAAPPPTPVAAPAAPPPAVVAPSKQMFIVFFEFDKSTLTPDGAKVVAAAASAFKSGKSGVAISGYTDLSGTQSYNMALSKRRADVVKSALVKDGVPTGAINESWHGKENPRVPTADGVREPQNRRVEITM